MSPMYIFQTHLITPIPNLGIFNFDASCPFISAIAYLPIVFKAFPFTLADIFLLQISLDIFLHPLHIDWTLFFTFHPQGLLFSKVDIKYLNSTTFRTPCTCCRHFLAFSVIQCVHLSRLQTLSLLTAHNVIWGN